MTVFGSGGQNNVVGAKGSVVAGKTVFVTSWTAQKSRQRDAFLLEIFHEYDALSETP